MAGISVSGVGSGLDINQIVSDLIAAEKAPATLRLDNKQATLEAKLSAFGTFQGAVSEFRSALSNINTAAKFQSMTATVSNTALFTASATSIAQAGTYDIEVTQLAQAQKLVTSDTQRFSAVTDVVGTGTLSFQVGSNAAQTITIDSSNQTLEGVRDAINKANVGARASIINDGQGFRLAISASNSGVANSLKITVAGDSIGSNTDQTGLSRLAYDPAAAVDSGKNMTQTLAAQDAMLKVDGLDVTSASNSVVGVVPGVTLSLKSKQVGTISTLTVAQDTAATLKSVDSFVAAYNTLMETSKSLTVYDAKDTSKNGILLGDSVVRSITNQVRGILTSSVNGATGAARSLADVGISLQKDGSLTLNSSKLQTALSADSQAVAALFTRTGVTTDPLVSYKSASSTSVAGTYAVSVSQLATQGQNTSSALGAGAGSFTINSGNNTFAIKVNGTAASAAITVSDGAYTGASMATELQTRINANTGLKNAGASVNVSYDDSNGSFTFTSSAYGSASKVEFTQANASLGISVGAGTAGVNVAGTIDGVTATGSGRTLTSSGTQGLYTGAAVSGVPGSFTIDSSNNTFDIKVNGVKAGATITLNSGAYTGAAMATELQTRINANASLAISNATVSVSYDTTNNRFLLTSNAYGSTSNVEFTAVDTNSLATLGLSTKSGVAGQNGPGIAVDVLGGAIGSRGTVSLSDGVAQRLDKALGDFLGSKGPLTSRTDSLNRQTTQLGTDRAALTKRLDALEARYRAQFTVMDRLVGQLTSISSYLTAQFFSSSDSS